MRMKSILLLLGLVLMTNLGSTKAGSHGQKEVYLLKEFNFKSGVWRMEIGVGGIEQKAILEKKLREHNININLPLHIALTNSLHLRSARLSLKGKKVSWQETTPDIVFNLSKDSREVWFAQVLFNNDNIIVQTEDIVTKELYGIEASYEALGFLKYAK